MRETDQLIRAEGVILQVPVVERAYELFTVKRGPIAPVPEEKKQALRQDIEENRQAIESGDMDASEILDRYRPPFSDNESMLINETYKQAFDEFLNRCHAGYIEILPCGELNLAEQGRVQELMDRHEENPDSLSLEEVELVAENSFVVHSHSYSNPYDDGTEDEILPILDEPLANGAENAMKDWLDSKGYAFEYVEQSKASFAKAYRGVTKRPDFQVMAPWGERIAVDVKVRRLNKTFNTFSIDEATEITKYRKYETMWEIPVWFAFSIEGSDNSNFYWISLQDVVVNVPIQNSSKSGGQFRPIPITLCTEIGPDGNLYQIIPAKENPIGETNSRLIGIPIPVVGLQV